MLFRDFIINLDFNTFKSINTGAVFKQYDVNSSILLLDLFFDNKTFNLLDKEVFVSVGTKDSLIVLNMKNKIENPNRVKFMLPEELLNLVGEFKAEVIIVNVAKERRYTSPTFKFLIEDSLLSNKPKVEKKIYNDEDIKIFAQKEIQKTGYERYM